MATGKQDDHRYTSNGDEGNDGDEQDEEGSGDESDDEDPVTGQKKFVGNAIGMAIPFEKPACEACKIRKKGCSRVEEGQTKNSGTKCHRCKPGQFCVAEKTKSPGADGTPPIYGRPKKSLGFIVD